MTKNTIRGIAIITGITKTALGVNRVFTEKEQLNQLLELFGHRPSGSDGEYIDPHKLVLATYSVHYAAGNNEIAEHVRNVFSWFELLW